MINDTVNIESICFKCRGDGFNIRKDPEMCESFKNNQCCYFYGYVTDTQMQNNDEYQSCPDELPLSELRYTEAYKIHGEIIKDIEKYRRQS